MTNKAEELEEIKNKLSKLTVLELAQLKKALEEEWGVTATAAPVMMAAPQAGDAGASQAAESTEFSVTLVEVPADKKMGAIKVVRELTGLGLKESKEFVESTPKVVKETAPKAEAEDIKKKLEAAGAKVTLKGL